MTQDIQTLRKEINQVDSGILNLVDRRMRLAEKIGQIKKADYSEPFGLCIGS